jgi:hypothetical protein
MREHVVEAKKQSQVKRNKKLILNTLSK